METPKETLRCPEKLETKLVGTAACEEIVAALEEEETMLMESIVRKEGSYTVCSRLLLD
jgi:hypothetical protein